MSLTCRQPAEDSAFGWERESLPVGNGFLGTTSSAPGYELLATRLTDCEFRDAGLDFAACEIVLYKVTACRPDGSGESDGPTATLNHATQLDIERHRHRVRQQNLDG